MALAFETVITSSPNGVNNEVFGVVDITLDNAYKQTAADGWTVAPSDLGVSSIHLLDLPTVSDGFVLEFEPADSKIKVYWADYDGVADGALVEYTDDGAGLNGDVIRCFFMGA